MKNKEEETKKEEKEGRVKTTKIYLRKTIYMGSMEKFVKFYVPCINKRGMKIVYRVNGTWTSP